jgi:tetratricopeptide (TPR) repeat protein
MSDKAYFHYCNGLFAYEIKDYTKAIEELSQSLAISEHFKTHELIALCYYEINNRVESFKHLSVAYSMNTDNDKTSVLYANALYDAGMVLEAKDILANVLVRNNSYGPAKKLLNVINS